MSETHASVTTTIVVPNYNHAQYLSDSLSSIVSQTRLPDEVIVIDDASTDNSVELIETILADKPNWRLIRNNERRGVIVCLNMGLAQAKGDWVLFLGADDGLLPNFLESALTQVKAAPSAGLISACTMIVDGTGRFVVRPAILPTTSAGYVSAQRFRQLLSYSDNFFSGTVTLYRQAALAALGGFNPTLGSLTDSFAARRLAARFGFGFIPEVLGFWRYHGANLSISVANDSEAVEKLIDIAKSALSTEPPGVFPAHYARDFERRLRFGAARTLILGHNRPRDERANALGDILGAGRLERTLLQTAMRLGVLGRFGMLVWSSLRLRPFSLYRLGLEPLRRFFFLRRHKVSLGRPTAENFPVLRRNA
ncbi:MAG: glycosyltransferase [Alphaproteobacteria bacterium]|nr:glycosyltransferase [Alphaproteobacteria bacterium]